MKITGLGESDTVSRCSLEKLLVIFQKKHAEFELKFKHTTDFEWLTGILLILQTEIIKREEFEDQYVGKPSFKRTLTKNQLEQLERKKK